MRVTVIIIAMSANAFYDDIERSIKAGMNTHIAKPIDADELVNNNCQNRQVDNRYDTKRIIIIKYML